jgi:hypothetical protein
VGAAQGRFRANKDSRFRNLVPIISIPSGGAAAAAHSMSSLPVPPRGRIVRWCDSGSEKPWRLRCSLLLLPLLLLLTALTNVTDSAKRKSVKVKMPLACKGDILAGTVGGVRMVNLWWRQRRTRGDSTTIYIDVSSICKSALYLQSFYRKGREQAAQTQSVLRDILRGMQQDTRSHDVTNRSRILDSRAGEKI